MRIELTTRTALLALTALSARGALAVPPAEDCAAILARSSTEWANVCAVKNGGSEEASMEALENALARYGECYDAATDALAKRLAGVDRETTRRAERCLPALDAGLDGFTEYALGAASAEESYRAGRLEKATKANRDKRAARLGEVREEVEELTALLQGIRDLQARSKSSAPRRTTKTRSTSRTGRTTTTGRRTRSAGAST